MHLRALLDTCIAKLRIVCFIPMKSAFYKSRVLGGGSHEPQSVKLQLLHLVRTVPG